MANNEQNKDWKQELEQIELRSSDLSFEKSVAWNKLYQRLEPKEKKRGAAWLKWAAVFIAFASLLIYYSINKSISKSEESAITEKRIKNDKAVTNPITAEVKENSKEEVIVNRIVENKSNKLSNTNPNRSKDVKASKLIVAEIKDVPAATVSISSPVTIAAPIADTFRYITKVSAPEKKKLRVIHINDYAVPVKPDIFMAENLKPGSKYFLRLNGFHSNNEFGNESKSDQAVPTIKINLSPQN